MSQVITANRLTDGIVVYVGHDGAWTGQLDEAKLFACKAEAETGLAAARDDAKRNLVVEPCLVDVTDEAGGWRPLTLRESIRALGPTVDFLPQSRVFTYAANPVPGHALKPETKARLTVPGQASPRTPELIGATGLSDEITR
ncbi:DUF2849 domain-containing protein [Methylocapsa sp. D3K7]|uniref:DUF2849 domain-containing protein n=1 Tax=Methylocapsa sp. D3K7 TaxID=3041435 RepID=UPI00244EA761|nr:DUF2849 domain-containing protein [Methylocapsa sp. D3K7]WGJ13937.1 DUF2849 domain-containing protein [Methylocapsa sp. D3K7]